jgi:hypothetical protein
VGRAGDAGGAGLCVVGYVVVWVFVHRWVCLLAANRHIIKKNEKEI